MTARLMRIAATAILATASLGVAAGAAHAGSERCPGNCHQPNQPTADANYVVSTKPLDPHGCREDADLRQSICPGFKP